MWERRDGVGLSGRNDSAGEMDRVKIPPRGGRLSGSISCEPEGELGVCTRMVPRGDVCGVLRGEGSCTATIDSFESSEPSEGVYRIGDVGVAIRLRMRSFVEELLLLGKVLETAETFDRDRLARAGTTSTEWDAIARAGALPRPAGGSRCMVIGTL